MRAGLVVLSAACCLLPSASLVAQITGGVHSMAFLGMSNSAHVSALGGTSVANPDNDISLALQNPAMMRPGLHNQLQLTYNAFYSDIKIMNLQYGYHVAKLNTSFALGVQYLNYGSMVQTDPLGNSLGDFKASDFAVSLAASRQYLEHWRYGATLKMASSNYGGMNASAAMMDVGVNYYDTASLWDIGLVARNMGVMLGRYTPGQPAEPLPFDLQIGISKRFKHLPLRLFTTIHHLYEWEIRYDNPADVTSSAFASNDTVVVKETSHFGDKLFRHFIFGAELTLGKRLVLTGSYNNLRRREMVVSTIPGLAGFAFGVGLNLTKWQIHYGRSYYHVAGAYNEFSLTMNLGKIMGMGKGGDRIHWNGDYGDW